MCTTITGTKPMYIFRARGEERERDRENRNSFAADDKSTGDRQGSLFSATITLEFGHVRK